MVIRRILLALLVLAVITALFAAVQHRRHAPIDRIVVEKSTRTLSIFRGGKKLKSYRVALGRDPVGPKEQEGDMKTPEGIYQIDQRKADSDYHLALHLSYPAPADV